MVALLLTLPAVAIVSSFVSSIAALALTSSFTITPEVIAEEIVMFEPPLNAVAVPVTSPLIAISLDVSRSVAVSALPVTSRDVTGNADTATLLETSRDIAISGDVTGTATAFNGGSNITISSAITSGVIVNDDVNASAAIEDTKLDTIATAGKVSNSATTATNNNTGSAIVARDASGNFSAGTISAALTGNVTGYVTS